MDNQVNGTKIRERKSAPKPAKKAIDENLGPVPKILARISSGDKSAVADLRAVWNDLPESIRSIGDMAKDAQNALLQAYLGKDQEMREALRAVMELRIEELRAKLAGPDPSPLESLLVDRIVLCWLQANHADYLSAKNDIVNERVGQHQNHTHRRLLSAVKALAQVRRLQIPMVQVNVADRQVNIQAGCPAPDEGG